MRKKISLFFSLFPLLVGCSSNNVPLEFVPYKNEGEIKEIEDIGTLSLNPSYPGLNNMTSISSLSDLGKAGGRQYLNSGGTAHLLVVPITFNEQEEDILNAKKTLIQNAFFGESKMTKYESVASYYHKSSYSHLKIEGEVADFVLVDDVTLKDVTSTRDTVIIKAMQELLREDETHIPFDISPYCTINPNYIDAVYFIYDYPYKNPDSVFWAITEHRSSPLSGTKVINYSWSSFDFMQDDKDDILKSHKVRANTYIHETGHLFGLVDYYNTKGYAYQPTGLMDMMDYNLGDHSSFSKYLLGWNKPIVVKEEGKITINSFSNDGDFILVPTSKYSNTPFDEYLLIEYFTPTGLNRSKEFPSYSYKDKDGNSHVFSYPTSYGLKVYHVDARLGYIPARPANPYAFIDDEDSKISSRYKAGQTYVDFYYDNSPSEASSSCLLHLLESSGENTFSNGYAASNSTLFRRFASFGKDTYQDFVFNNGELLPYWFEVKEFTANKVTIDFHKK